AVEDAPAFSPARLREVEPPMVDAPDQTLMRWKRFPEALAVAGDGAVAYRNLLNGLSHGEMPPPLAASIARIAMARAKAAATLDPTAVHPLYVRRPDAEMDRLRRRNTIEPADPTAVVDANDARRTEGAAGTWTIETVSSAPQIDGVMAIEHASFTNPW